MREMYGEYRELKAAMDKENARAAVRGKPTSPAATPALASEARATRVDSPPPSRTPRDSARTCPRTPSASDPGPPPPSPPARPESSDDDDDDVVDATPVKLPTRVQPDRAAKSPARTVPARAKDPRRDVHDPMASPPPKPKPRATLTVTDTVSTATTTESPKLSRPKLPPRGSSRRRRPQGASALHARGASHTRRHRGRRGESASGGRRGRFRPHRRRTRERRRW